MTPEKWRRNFNLAGASVLLIWVTALGLWIHALYVDRPTDEPRTTGDAAPVRTPQEDWMEIFLKGKKVGYALRQLSPVDDGYLVRDEIVLRLNLMGKPNTVRAATRAALDRDCTVKTFTFTMTSGVVTFAVLGTVEEDRIVLEIGQGKNRRHESVEISSPPMISTSLAAFFKGRRMKIGETFHFPLFDPSMMVQKQVAVRVAEKEAVRIYGIDYDAFRLEADVWGTDMRFWVGEDGTILKEEGFLGLTLVKSSAARAESSVDDSGGEDLYGLAAVSVNKTIWHPERLTFLTLRVSGADNLVAGPQALNGGRQRFHDGKLEITRETLPRRAPYVAPWANDSIEMRAYLKPEFGIESDHAAVIRQLKDIAGDRREPVALSRVLMNWVYRELEKRPVMNVPTALQVLESRAGDCNEHAALLTALLRAAGIPARLCAGLVYRRGAFYYHAWNEAYLGEWISMDATFNQMPADATHIKLVEGGLDSQARLIGVIGKIKLEVITHGYD